MAAPKPDPTDLFSLFPKFSSKLATMAPKMIRATYDQLVATCDQPEKLRSIVREHVHTRFKLLSYVDKFHEEEKTRKKAEVELIAVRREPDVKLLSHMTAETNLAVQKEATEAVNAKIKMLEHENKTIRQAYLEQARTIQAMGKRKRDDDTLYVLSLFCIFTWPNKHRQ